MTPNDDPVRPSSLAAFLEAVNGKRGDLDAWLEVNDEAEVRAHILAALSTRPQAAAAVPLSEEQIEAIAHRKAWRYRKSSDPHHSDTYTFNRACLIEFVRALGITPPEGAAE
jgi:hypothetical protein